MEGEKRKHKRFDKDFKLSAVKMITDGGHKASEVARSLDIHPNMLYSWKSNMPIMARRLFPEKEQLVELASLRRQLREVEMERGIFSKTTESGSGL